MKKILYLLSVIFLLGSVVSCEKESEGLSRITHYAEITLEGPSTVVVPLGSEYEEPGYTAIEGETDVTDQVDVETNLDVNEAGVYEVRYIAVNDDGFASTESRTVLVYDTTPSIISSGIHTIAEGSHRIWFEGGAKVDFSGYEIVILQTEPGVFYISDFMGGYYAQRAGYGSDYAMSGSFELNEDNTITPLSSTVPGWGDSMDEMTSSSVDPETGQISYTMEYAGLMEFNIIIN